MIPLNLLNGKPLGLGLWTALDTTWTQWSLDRNLPAHLVAE
jgi:hypothetical protein